VVGADRDPLTRPAYMTGGVELGEVILTRSLGGDPLPSPVLGTS
jgi:hypothetical protein